MVSLDEDSWMGGGRGMLQQRPRPYCIRQNDLAMDWGRGLHGFVGHGLMASTVRYTDRMTTLCTQAKLAKDINQVRLGKGGAPLEQRA